jgi:hypothetical protein
MKDKKERSDRAHKLSDVCVKILLAGLAFSATAFALAERIREIPPFEAFGKFVLARETLTAQIADLEEDPCWKLYSTALSDPTAVLHTTLRELHQVQCSDQAPNTVRVGSKSITIGASHVLVLNPDGSEAVTPKIAKPPPAVSQVSSSVIPATPTGFHTELWLPLPEAETISTTIKTLWDDSTLERAQRYSGVAAEEIYRWRLHRSRLFKRRVSAPQLGSSHPPTEATFDVSKLWIGDLKEIDNVSHTSLTELDRVLRDQFRAPLPDASYGVNIGTATQIVAAILTLLAAALQAYVRAACNADAKSTPGTVFHVLTGSLWGELVIYTVFTIPLAAVAYLDVAISVKGSAGVYFSVCAVAILIMTLSTLRRLLARQATESEGKVA